MLLQFKQTDYGQFYIIPFAASYHTSEKQNENM